MLCTSAVCQEDISSWTAVQNASGSRLRLTFNNGKEHSGVMVRASNEELVLRERAGEKTYSKGSIVKIESLGGKKRGRGALIGLGVGFGSGAIIGLAGTSGCSPGEFCTISRAAGTAVGALIGAIAGASIGALVGGGRHKTMLYMAPAPAQK